MCEVDPESLTDTLVALASEGVKMDKREAAHVLGKWRYASHIDRLALYEKACHGVQSAWEFSRLATGGQWVSLGLDPVGSAGRRRRRDARCRVTQR